MKVVASPEVAEHVRERGGRLFVWTDPHRCCGGGMTYLKTASEPPAGARAFAPVAAEGFELFFDPGRLEPPDEVHFEVKGRRTKRVEAYWNGCAFAI